MNNPLEHFGIKTQFIRRDATTYNKQTCRGKHDYGEFEEREHPNPDWQQVKKCKKCGYELAKGKHEKYGDEY
jgi:hypothetical protein